MLLTCWSGIFFITFNLLSSLITEAVVTTTIRSATLLFMLIYTERNLVRAISGRETHAGADAGNFVGAYWLSITLTTKNN